MICNNCGRQSMSENAKFCEYCGGSLKANTPVNPLLPNQAVVVEGDKEKPVSFLNWLGSYALMFIPFVGGLVFLIMLFVWAFGDYVPESKKNWARALLVVIGIVIVLAIIILIFVFNNLRYFDSNFGDFNFDDILKEYNYQY